MKALVIAAVNRLAASAKRTASWNTRRSDADLIRRAAERISTKAYLKANVAVLKVADAMIGALLDLKV